MSKLTIAFSEYIAKELDNNISYMEYLGIDKSGKRKRKIKKIFKNE